MSSEFIFHGDLSDLLCFRWQKRKSLVLPVTRNASVKDVIESLGIPHTEIGRIECNGLEIDFSFPVENNRKYDVHNIVSPWVVIKSSHLRPQPLAHIRFIVDVNVGRLAKYLRMAGFDTAYSNSWNDKRIAELSSRDHRIVLSRDKGLLKRKKVVFGRYIRNENPVEQFAEIMSLLDLAEKAKPFSRCLECNTLLCTIAKEKIVRRLEPLTIRFYDSFSICKACNKIYWPGSHSDKMKQLMTAACPDVF